jgi:hypothetical protein
VALPIETMGRGMQDYVGDDSVDKFANSKRQETDSLDPDAATQGFLEGLRGWYRQLADAAEAPSATPESTPGHSPR